MTLSVYMFTDTQLWMNENEFCAPFNAFLGLNRYNNIRRDAMKGDSIFTHTLSECEPALATVMRVCKAYFVIICKVRHFRNFIVNIRHWVFTLADDQLSVVKRTHPHNSLWFFYNQYEWDNTFHKQTSIV